MDTTRDSVRIMETEAQNDLQTSLTDETDLNAEIEKILNPRGREQPVYIDDLEDAVEIDLVAKRASFKPKPGQQVIIEKWFANRWMGTNLYTVRSVDVKTGDLALHDDDNQQAAMANFVTGVLKHGWRFKLPIPGLVLNKREAPKVVSPKVERPKNPDGSKPRGRPKGSKNRSSEEIAADLHEKVLEKRARREAREAKKR